MNDPISMQIDECLDSLLDIGCRFGLAKVLFGSEFIKERA